MCTSWPVTPSSCHTSASRWPPRAPQAWPWPPHPAPPTAAPQTEPTPLNWLTEPFERMGWGRRHTVSPPPKATHLAMKNPSETGQTMARGGWEVLGGLGRKTHVTLHPSHAHPPQSACPPFSKGWHCSGGQSPGRLTQQGVKFGIDGGKWGSVFGIFLFCLKKKIKRSVELLQLGQMERTAEGLVPIRTQIHPCMSHSGPR